MFTNVGGKIKGVVTVFTAIGIIASCILGFYFIIPGGAREDGSLLLVLLGLVIIAGGCLLSWISSLLIYGYGQLIENTEKLVGKFEAENIKVDNVDKTGRVEKCALCGKTGVKTFPGRVVEGGEARFKSVCGECYDKHNCT